MGFVLILGGARSGKSDLASRLAGESGRPVTFIATATAGDAEMAERIQRHREARPQTWTTVEAPLDLAGAIAASAAGDFVIVDCLTLWVSNLIGEGRPRADCMSLAAAAAAAMTGCDGVVVSNEVGMGVVPPTELGREFRDLLGSVNACFAESAQRALLLVAGRALELGQA